MDDVLNPIVSPTLDAAFPNRLVIEGAWMGHVPFGHWLVYAARPRTLVELGTYFGTSLDAFNSSVVRFGVPTRTWGVDTWQGDLNMGEYGDHVFQHIRGLVDEQYANFCTLLRMQFDEAVKTFEDGSIDILHIDGLHTYDAVKSDFYTWRSKLSSKAIVLFHDTEVIAENFGVNRFWREIREQYWGFNFPHSNGLGVLVVGEDPPTVMSQLKAAPDDVRAAFVRRFQQIGDGIKIDQGQALDTKLRDLEAAHHSLQKKMWNIRGSFGHRLRFAFTGR